MPNTSNTPPTALRNEVKAYLKNNPEALTTFLVENPEVVKTLNLPSAHQNGVTDFHNFKTQKLEREITRLKAKNRQLLEMSIDNLKSQEQIHTLVLDILNAPSLPELLHHLHQHLKEEMAVDHTHLCLVHGANAIGQKGGNLSYVEEELLTSIFKTPETFVTLRTLYEDEQKALHGTWASKAQSDALLKLQTPQGDVLGFLALVSTERERFHQGQGTELLKFIAHVIGHMFTYWVHEKTIQKTG